MLDGELRLLHEGQADGYTPCVAGQLDTATTRELVETVAQRVGQGVAALTLDLGAVKFMDSTGLHGLFASKRRRFAQGMTDPYLRDASSA